ncbi:MAG: T9SS type A sorting domain-containing protein [Bacteroidales bacterium]|nr:T9SS type A sorting domain-containing protein [Bacteroidales bacterium]
MKKVLQILALFFFTFTLNAQNLINDGAFDTYNGVLAGRTSDEWGAWTDNGSVVEVVEGVAVCTPGAATPEEPWHAQLEQWEAPLENDVTYLVKFKAWADADKILQLTIEDPNNNYRRLGETPDEDGEVRGDYVRSKWSVNITTEETVYTRTVTIDSVMENTAVKFGFLYGATTDVVYIDDVSLQDETTGINIISVSSFNAYPNPAYETLHIPDDISVRKIEILNLLGQPVYSENQSNNLINVSTLNAGIYFLKATDALNNVYVSKFTKSQ